MDLSHHRDLHELLRRQDGVILRTQHDDAGLSASAFDRLVHSRALVPMFHGVYAHAASVPTPHQRRRGALLFAGGDAALARHTAAELHGLPVWPDDTIHLLVRDRTFASRPRGLVVHRSSSWCPERATDVDGLRVTDVPRTLLDLAGRLSLFQLRKAVRHAVRHRMTKLEALHLEAQIAGAVPGVRNFRQVATELSPLHAQTASELESLFVEISTAHGMAPTAMNHPVRDAFGRTRYLDAVYLPEHLPIELDGRVWHGLVTDRDDDARRENAIVLTGRWRSFVRFTWTDLTERAPQSMQVLSTALTAARVDRATPAP